MTDRSIFVGSRVSLIGRSGIPVWKVTSMAGDTVTLLSISVVPPWKGQARTVNLSEVVLNDPRPMRPTFS